MLKGLKRRTSFLFILCFLWGACPVSAETHSEQAARVKAAPEMTATLSPDQARVGGIVNLVLKFHLPHGAGLSSEPEVQGLQGLQVLDRSISFSGAGDLSGKEEKNGREGPAASETSFSGECRMRLMVDRLDSGQIGPLSLSYRDAKGEKQFLKSAPVALTVLSNLGDKPEEAELKPIYGIMPTGSRWHKYRPWILGGAALLLMGALCGWWIRKRRGKGRDAVIQRPPHELAEEALKALDGKKLFEKGRVKDFYFDFSEILRRYVEGIRGFPAVEYTVEEIARVLKKKEDQVMLSLLRQADMVKFADFTMTSARKTQHMETAFAYIQHTREAFLKEERVARQGSEKPTAGAVRTRKVREDAP